MFPDEAERYTGFAAEAIRMRPTMYVGPLDNPLIPTELLQEAFCMPIAEARSGRCRELNVQLDRGGVARIVDDGPGWPVDADRDGKRLAECLLTELYACRAAHLESGDEAENCTLGIVVLNAFSAELLLVTHRDGHKWRQSYSQGMPTSKFENLGPTEERGTELSFRLDHTVLPSVEFNLDAFVLWLQKIARGIAIRITDERSSQRRYLEAT